MNRFETSAQALDNAIKSKWEIFKVIFRISLSVWIATTLTHWFQGIVYFPLYKLIGVWLCAWLLHEIVGWLLGLWTLILTPGGLLLFAIYRYKVDIDIRNLQNLALDLKDSFLSCWWSFIAGMFLCIAVIYLYGRNKHKEKHLQGTEVVPAREYIKSLKKVKSNGYYWLGNLPLHQDLMIRNIAMVGIGGSGKSTLIRYLVQEIRERNIKAIVLDPSIKSYDYTGKFFNPDTDIILNPLDARAHRIDLFELAEESKDESVWTKLANVLIPESAFTGTNSIYWVKNSRKIMTKSLQILYNVNKGMSDCRDLFCTSDLHTVFKTILKTEPEFTFIEKRNSDQTAAFLSTLAEWCGLWKYLYFNAPLFNVKDWLETDGGGIIFLPSLQHQGGLTKHLFTIYLEFIASFLMGRKDSADFKFHIVADELQSLHKLTVLPELLQGRSKGIGTIVGFHDLPELEAIYGRHETRHLWNQFGTRFYFSQNSGDQAQWIAQEIGQRKTEGYQSSELFGWHESKEGFNLAQRVGVESAILASEIQKFQDLEAICQIKGHGTFHNRFPWKEWPELGVNFEPHPDFRVDTIQKNDIPTNMGLENVI